MHANIPIQPPHDSGRVAIFMAQALQPSNAIMATTPIGLQHSALRDGQTFGEIVHTLAGMAGILETRSTRLRGAAELAVVLGFSGLLWFSLGMGVELAMLTFGVLFALRHAFLFASFRQGGIASLLHARFGSERGFALHSALTAFLLFGQRAGFVALLLATGDHTGAWSTAWPYWGAVLVIAGVSMSVWATRIIGVDNYYYRDLFMGPQHVSLSSEGPYALFANPIYGVGQLAVYGVALMAGSVEGVLAAVSNQVASYAFHMIVERPHLRAATRISVDVGVQEALARSTLAFGNDPIAIGGISATRPPPRRRAI